MSGCVDDGRWVGGHMNGGWLDDEWQIDGQTDGGTDGWVDRWDG